MSETTSGRGITLLESASSGLPFGWLFLFGSRNIWEPGQSVEERGGAAARRDPTTTPIDVAQVRLQEAASALIHDELLGLAYAPLALLERCLGAAGEQGQLRLQSPAGVFGEEKDPAGKRRRFLEHVAVAENIVFHLGRQNREMIGKALESLRDLCPFVPTGDPRRDWKEMQKAARKLGGGFPPEEMPVRLLVGWPAGPPMNTIFAAEAPALAAQLREKAEVPGGEKPWWAFWKRSE